MSEKGFIRLNRKFFENALWKEPREYSRAEAWLDLIQSARFDSSSVIVKGRVLDVQKGEIAASRRYLEARWGWGSTKVGNFLDVLKQNQMITIKQTSGQTILSLCNYSLYNEPQTNQQTTDKPLTNQRQTSDKPNNKKDKEFKKEIIPPIIPPNGGTGESIENWRNSYDVYISELKEAYTLAVNDQKWMAQREKFHPSLNIKRSLNKAYTDFWGTEAGWHHKKSERKTKIINWRTTLANALTLRANQVYREKNE